MQTPGSNAFNLIETNDYGVRLEYTKDFAILHLPYVHRFTKEVLQDMQHRLDELATFFKTIGYGGVFTAVEPKDKKIIRLLNKLDFVFQGQADGLYVFQYRS